ncbi:murein transglycosylase [Gluconobacter potus]|uniref:Transglycosylase n=5 Tax=Acetobacteraceae TaxID=433 RepID=A0A511XR32_9PROT|nr:MULTISPECIES: lytic transglycosylase domain-containing protein [Acetobacteraceae]GBO82409.1 lytic transglycosylase [Acetobacter aceti NRIC 0242]KXV00312.1 murein transglycosylase [Gluconobacter potus]MBB3883189.1 soluble lytic murein transglycosylase-like protein [Acetobacter oeni]MBF0851934.1 lytic transglycosylase domain-containing protein [Gluconobacter sp. R75690]MBF0875568.1 lytic transglycosylase domain-containing protein [Gluconobacter cerevisiae]
MRRAFFLAVGITAIGVLAAADQTRAASVSTLAGTDPFAAQIAEAVRRFDVPTAWIRAVMRAESGGDTSAISSKGAVGLMQIMPTTWANLRVRYGLGSDPFDVHDNILAGAAYLREMHDRYGSPGFLAAYNAGPGRYEDFRDRHRPLPPETLAYVAGLLPLLGQNGDTIPLLAVHPDPLAWRRAPIFIALANDASANITARDLSPIAPHSAGLFVTVSDREPAP